MSDNIYIVLDEIMEDANKLAGDARKAFIESAEDGDAYIASHYEDYKAIVNRLDKLESDYEPKDDATHHYIKHVQKTIISICEWFNREGLINE